MKYLHWNEKTVTDFSEKAINDMYENGYVFTRIGKGVMHQTRAVRIDLDNFSLSSENRRILKKTENLKFDVYALPFENYDYSIGKLAKDFYDLKFGTGVMSAQKIKMMLCDDKNSNFNLLMAFKINETICGYAICYLNNDILHYSYPFYSLNVSNKDMGLGMMITALQYAQLNKRKYVYLGSMQRPSDTYKLQFNGLEWYDGKIWQSDIKIVKKILTSDKIKP